jgi:hypothetical protein
MPANKSVYNDQYFDISSVPSWKTPPGPPLHGAYSENAKLSPRAKAGIAAGGVVLAATGMVAWSNYSAEQANADVRKAQIALEKDKVDLQRQQQQAAQAQQAGQETEAQKARREAVSACVAKASGFDAVSNCAKAFPEITSTTDMAATASTVNAAHGSPVPVSGLVALGAVGSVLAVSWVKKRLPRM